MVTDAGAGNVGAGGDAHDGSGRPGSVVVTGAAGFIGSHLVERLLDAGHQVLGIDDFDGWYDPAVKQANLAAAMDRSGFTLVDGDLGGGGDAGLDADRLADLLTGADVVFHLAGRPGVQDSWGAGFADYVERTVHVTQRVYEAARAADVGRVVYASSSSVYGTSSAVGGDRTTTPVSPYGVSKLAGEHLAGVYRVRGLSITSLRYFTVYGPRQRPDMAMHRLFRATMADGPTFVLRGDGRQRREFTHVGDVAAATEAAGWRPEADGATIDIGGGSSVALREVIDLVERIAGAPVRLRSLPVAAGDPAATVAEHEAARSVLGWEPVTDLEAGLTSQWAWHAGAAGAGDAGSDTRLVAD
ncbi:MAG: NAD-dependent epimerase/dehydratase family protein [Actinomycetota bacterium]